MKNLSFWLMALLYAIAGAIHFIQPVFYLQLMPAWMPTPRFLVYSSGLCEMLLAVLLIPRQTRNFSIRLIICMLLVFLFAIHIPQAFRFYQSHDKYLLASLVRLPIQFLLMAWARSLIIKPV